MTERARSKVKGQNETTQASCCSLACSLLLSSRLGSGVTSSLLQVRLHNLAGSLYSPGSLPVLTGWLWCKSRHAFEYMTMTSLFSNGLIRTQEPIWGGIYLIFLECSLHQGIPFSNRRSYHQCTLLEIVQKSFLSHTIKNRFRKKNVFDSQEDLKKHINKK